MNPNWTPASCSSSVAQSDSAAAGRATSAILPVSTAYLGRENKAEGRLLFIPVSCIELKATPLSLPACVCSVSSITRGDCV
ncbi:UNVERIFIED_CONTAM: hypothetical protein FKN15_063809 [Acipenser sinensis]